MILSMEAWLAADAANVVGDYGKPGHLGFDQEVGQRFSSGGMDCDIALEIKGSWIFQKSSELDAVGDVESLRLIDAGSELGSLAG